MDKKVKKYKILGKKFKKKKIVFFFKWEFFLPIKVSGPVSKTSALRTVRTFKIYRTSRPDVMSGRALVGRWSVICQRS